MKAIKKPLIEVLAIILLNVLYFFTAQDSLAPMMYIIPASVVTIYYVLLEISRFTKAKSNKMNLFIPLLIASTIILSIISLFVSLNQLLKIALFISSIAYLLILIFYRKLEAPRIFLLIAANALSIGVYFLNFG